MLLSIIIVNYNSGDSLERTFHALEKLIIQPQVELIVIDGGSNDIGLNIISSHRDDIDKFLCEPDKGIYDAMNKAISLGIGKWVWFINAGDSPLIDANVCIELLNDADSKGYNYVYSDVSISGVVLKQNFSLGFLMQKMVNHQSCIYRNYLLEGGYDISYRYCADYAHLLNIWDKIKSFKADYILCDYDITGISSLISRKRRLGIWSERFRAQANSSLPIMIKIIFLLFSLIVILVKIINPSTGSIRNKLT